MLDFGRLELGMQCRLARVARGWSLFELAKRADADPPRISEWERGLVALPPATIERIQRTLEEGDGDDLAAA